MERKQQGLGLASNLIAMVMVGGGRGEPPRGTLAPGILWKTQLPIKTGKIIMPLGRKLETARYISSCL